MLCACAHSSSMDLGKPPTSQICPSPIPQPQTKSSSRSKQLTSVAAIGMPGWTMALTAPFVCGCGKCHECISGNAQVCLHQWQPRFSRPGSIAEYVAIPNADFNIVIIPNSMSFEIAASLGCRFATSYRGLALIHRPRPGECVAIFGCGGIGLAAIMVAKSRGAQVIAIDISNEALAFAKEIGADHQKLRHHSDAYCHWSRTTYPWCPRNVSR